MSKPKKNKERMKETFLNMVKCFEIERIRFGYFKPFFKDDPVMLAIIDTYMAEQRRIKHVHAKVYEGPNIEKVVIANMFES